MKTYRVGGVEMEYPIIVGGGACKSIEAVEEYMREDVSVGGVEAGSFTPDMRDGNTEAPQQWPPTFGEFMALLFGLNAWGMPNYGFRTAFQKLQELFAKQLPGMKPIIINIAGFSIQDFVEGVKLFGQAASNVAAIVLNLACPNAHDATEILAFNLEFRKRLLTELAKLKIGCPLWIKESLYPTTEEMEELARLYPMVDFSRVLRRSIGFCKEIAIIEAPYAGFLRAKICANTFGNCVVLGPDGKPVTTPNSGRAGLSGKPTRPTMLRMIREFREYLPKSVDLIALGGNLHGDDAVECFENGAQAVSYTSGPSWYGNGPRFAANFIQESERFQNYLSQHIQQD